AIPHFVVPVDGIPASDLEITPVVNIRFWREIAVWLPAQRGLACGDALGTARSFRAGDEPLPRPPPGPLRAPRVPRPADTNRPRCARGSDPGGGWCGSGASASTSSAARDRACTGPTR